MKGGKGCACVEYCSTCVGHKQSGTIWLSGSFLYSSAVQRKEVEAVHILSLVTPVLGISGLALFIYLVVLLIRALRKYIRGGPARAEARAVRTSLSEKLRENRTRCKMSQEFVAESLGVTRQAVSKWETGQSDPSTANLLALAKLYGVSAEELLKGM